MLKVSVACTSGTGRRKEDWGGRWVGCGEGENPRCLGCARLSKFESYRGLDGDLQIIKEDKK